MGSGSSVKTIAMDSFFWAILVASCWGGGIRSSVGFWPMYFAHVNYYGSSECLLCSRTVGYFLAIYFLWLGMSWSWEEQPRANDLSLFSLFWELVCIPNQNIHAGWDNREEKIEERGDGDWLSLSGKESNVGNRRFSCISCPYLAFSLGPITDPLTVVISSDITGSQNSWGWKGPLEIICPSLLKARSARAGVMV